MANNNDNDNPSTPENAAIEKSINITSNRDSQSVISRISSLRSTPGSQGETPSATSLAQPP